MIHRRLTLKVSSPDTTTGDETSDTTTPSLLSAAIGSRKRKCEGSDQGDNGSSSHPGASKSTDVTSSVHGRPDRIARKCPKHKIFWISNVYKT